MTSRIRCVVVRGGVLLGGLFFATSITAQSIAPIEVTAAIPSELNPPYVAGAQPSGGAPNATPEQAARFAWQEFIALNWPAAQQDGHLGQRGTASANSAFGDPSYSGLTVWETLRSKVEIFPGEGSPPGYDLADKSTDFGFDALPKYNYDTAKAKVTACDASQANEPIPCPKSAMKNYGTRKSPAF